MFVSLLASCAMHGIEPWAYLRDLFCLLPRWPEHQVLELAPAYWAGTCAREDVQAKLAANVYRAATPDTFNFLGFTHICAKTMAGKFLVTRRTMQKRMREKLRAVKTELQRRRHQPIPAQGQWLGSVVRGYLAYHAVPTNIHAMHAFRVQVTRHWYRSLRRRSQRTRRPGRG